MPVVYPETSSWSDSSFYESQKLAFSNAVEAEAQRRLVRTDSKLRGFGSL